MVDDVAEVSTVLSVTLRRAGFDDKLPSSRRTVVNALFDQLITFRHAALKAAFKDKPDVKSRLETEWDSTDRGNYAKTIDRAEQAARAR